MSDLDSMRLDKWLWCARFYKTRSLAAEEVGKGRVEVNHKPAKASKEIRPGDVIHLRQGPMPKEVIVRSLSAMRGPASIAQQLYEETEQSIALRTQIAEQRRLAPEPATQLSDQHSGRPTKRDRREIDRLRQSPSRSNWGDRWSASIDD